MKPFQLWLKYKEEATQNGISRYTFIWRIYRKWDPKEAANTLYHVKRESLYK